MSARPSLTGLLAVALAASTAFAPAVSGDSAQVDRHEVDCAATTEPWTVGPEGATDLCAVEMRQTADQDEVLVGFEVALEVVGEVVPAHDRVYTITLESHDERPWVDGCELELNVGGFDGAGLTRAGSCGDGGTALERIVTDEAVENATLTIDGGRVAIAFDLSRWDGALAELLDRSRALTVSASVNHSSPTVRSWVARMTSFQPADVLGPIVVDRFGVLPSTLTADPCAEVRSWRVAEDTVLCNGAVTAVVGDDGALEAVRLVASARSGQELPDRLTWHLGARPDLCRGLVEVLTLPDGSPRVTAGSYSCHDRDARPSTGLDEFVNYLRAALPGPGTVLLPFDVHRAAQPCVAATGRAAGVALYEGSLADPQSMLVEPEDPMVAAELCGELPDELGRVAAEHGLDPASVAALIDHLRETLPGQLEQLAEKLVASTLYDVDRVVLDYAQLFTGVALHEVPGAVVEHMGEAIVVTVPASTGVGSVDDMLLLGRAFSGLAVDIGQMGVVERMELPGFTLGG